MSVTTFIARRYMQAGRSNRFFSWITVLTIAGVAIGVAAMIVVWSVINGFEKELRQRFLAANAHIMLYKFPSGIGPGEERELRHAIPKDFEGQIKGVAPFIYYETMAQNGSVLHGILVHGIIPSLHEKVQPIAEITRPPGALKALQREVDLVRAHKPLPAVPSVVIGSGLLSLLDAKVGDDIQLVEPEKQDLAAMKKFRVVGVYDSGLKSYDNKLVLMSVPTAQSFFGMRQNVTGLEIGLTDPWAAPQIGDAMSDKYDLRSRDWLSLNRPLFEAIKVERLVILLITSIVAGVAGFNILTTIFVAVSQRQRDVSILKALGATNGQVLWLFVKQGLFVGIVGGVIGVVLALGISALLERYQFVDLPDLYLLARLPLSYDWWVYATVAGLSLFIATIAGIFPAYMASRVDPVEGFRGNQGAA